MSEYPDVQVTVSLNIWCLPGTSKSGRAVNGVSPVNVLFHAGTDVSRGINSRVKPSGHGLPLSTRTRVALREGISRGAAAAA